MSSSESEDSDDISLASDSDESLTATSDDEPKTNTTTPKKAAVLPASAAKKVPSNKRSDQSAQPAVIKRAKKDDVVPSKPLSDGAMASKVVESKPTATVITVNEEDITRGPDVTTEPAAKKLVLKYLFNQNRPYSAIQIHDNLHKRIPKTLLERCLNVLCEDAGETAQILCKEYGKAKIYFPNQHTLTSDFTVSLV